MLLLHGGKTPASELQMLAVDTFFANGTWTSPAHAGNAVVRGWGGGAGNVIDTSSGGGGAYAQLDAWAFAPSTGYTVTVGAGGTGNGGDTTLNGTDLVAEGGYANGTAGAAANSTGDVRYDGGAGVVGAGSQVGGGGAGSQGAASGITPGEPDGGRGGTAAVAGQAGFGGGAGSHVTAQRWGHRGELRVEYDTPATAGFPRLRSYNVGRSTTTNTSHTIDMPAGIEAGDLLVCVFACDATSGGASMSGWTELFERNESSANQVTAAVYYKTATGGDTGTVTTASARWSAHVTLRVAGAGTPTATATDAQTADADPPSHDAGSLQKHLWLALVAWDSSAAQADSSGSFIGGIPSGFGGAITVGSNGGSPPLCVCMRLEEVQTKDPAAFTSGAEQYVAATIAIPPA